MKLNSIAVFCGSKAALTACMNSMHMLGKNDGGKNIKLVYGGGNKGLMGAVANAVMEMAAK
jgi:predicted Rossmann-fold nucleotide-binding protein